MTDPIAMLLNENDNVLVCCRDVASGEIVDLGVERITVRRDVLIGHKLARRPIQQGDIVYKYGVPIGSMTISVAAGDWVHVHNMKSDYIAVHDRGAGRVEP